MRAEPPLDLGREAQEIPFGQTLIAADKQLLGESSDLSEAVNW
jgi:hypothetical protein